MSFVFMGPIKVKELIITYGSLINEQEYKFDNVESAITFLESKRKDITPSLFKKLGGYCILIFSINGLSAKLIEFKGSVDNIIGQLKMAQEMITLSEQIAKK